MQLFDELKEVVISSSSNSSSGYSSGARAVNTGDSNNILLWVCALLISMSVLFALKRRRG